LIRIVVSVSLMFVTSSGWSVERIVSINQCADELLLHIVPPDRIISVTHFVKDPRISWDADLARDIPGNSGRAEEVMSHRPDLVFAGDFSARSTVNLLRGLGVRVIELAHPSSIDDVLDLIAQVGQETGFVKEAETIRTKLSSSRQASSPQTTITAAVYQPNGYTVGKGSLINEVLELAGIRNVAAFRGLASYDRYPMELLILDKPDLLILDPQVHASPSLSHEMLSHPALGEVFAGARRVEVPPQAWACGTHHVFAALKIIRAAAQSVRAGDG